MASTIGFAELVESCSVGYGGRLQRGVYFEVRSRDFAHYHWFGLLVVPNHQCRILRAYCCTKAKTIEAVIDATTAMGLELNPIRLIAMRRK